MAQKVESKLEDRLSFGDVMHHLSDFTKNTKFELAVAAQWSYLSAYYHLLENRPLVRSLLQPFDVLGWGGLFATTYDVPVYGEIAGTVQALMNWEIPIILLGRVVYPYIQRSQARQHGREPLVFRDSPVILADCEGIPLANALGRKLTEGKRGIPSNLGLLMTSGAAGITNPNQGAFRNWYLDQGDPGMSAFETDVLEKGGVFDAKSVVINHGNYESAMQVALTIHRKKLETNSEFPMVHPVIFSKTQDEVLYYDNTRDQLPPDRISEITINPAMLLRESVQNLLTDNIKTPKEYFHHCVSEVNRQDHLRNLQYRISELRKKKAYGYYSVYLNGDSDCEKGQVLRWAFDRGLYHYRFNLADSPESADLILSYGSGKLTDDLSVNEYSRRVWEDPKLKDKLFLAVTYSQETEDNTLFYADGVTSFQRLTVDKISELVGSQIKFRLTPWDLLKIKASGAPLTKLWPVV